LSVVAAGRGTGVVSWLAVTSGEFVTGSRWRTPGAT